MRYVAPFGCLQSPDSFSHVKGQSMEWFGGGFFSSKRAIFWNNLHECIRTLYPRTPLILLMWELRKAVRFLSNTIFSSTGSKPFSLCHGAVSVFSSTGHRPASLCHGPLSIVRLCVRLSVHALTFSLNIFFSETTYPILMKFHRNVPTMVLFRMS